MNRNTSFWQLALPVCFLLNLFLAPLVQAAGSTVSSLNTTDDYIADISPDGLYNWSKSKMPIKVFLQSGIGVAGYQPTFPQVLRTCFDEWSMASNGRLAWTEVKDARDADIVVSWHDHPREDQNGTEAGRTKTFTSYNTATNRGVINHAEMHLLTQLPERQLTGAEVRKAYLHEVGHAFGIAGHSSDRRDIMYRAVCSQQRPELDERDIATINHLYGQEPQQMQISKQADPARGYANQNSLSNL